MTHLIVKSNATTTFCTFEVVLQSPGELPPLALRRLGERSRRGYDDYKLATIVKDKTILATKLSVGTVPERGYTMNQYAWWSKKGGSISLGGSKALDTRAPRGPTSLGIWE